MCWYTSQITKEPKIYILQFHKTIHFTELISTIICSQTHNTRIGRRKSQFSLSLSLTLGDFFHCSTDATFYCVLHVNEIRVQPSYSSTLAKETEEWVQLVNWNHCRMASTQIRDIVCCLLFAVFIAGLRFCRQTNARSNLSTSWISIVLWREFCRRQ